MLIKYSGKYVKIYFHMKITCFFFYLVLPKFEMTLLSGYFDVFFYLILVHFTRLGMQFSHYRIYIYKKKCMCTLFTCLFFPQTGWEWIQMRILSMPFS